MNEKFLSRGKREDNGEWITGYLIEQNDPEYHAYIIKSFKADIDNRHIDILECDIEDVIPETVGRCTGLTDKNGKMIFEGDILDASWALVGLVVIRFGRYKDVFNTGARGEYGHIGFYAECPHDEWVRKDICYFNSKSEIVGNIHVI